MKSRIAAIVVLASLAVGARGQTPGPNAAVKTTTVPLDRLSEQQARNVKTEWVTYKGRQAPVPLRRLQRRAVLEPERGVPGADRRPGRHDARARRGPVALRRGRPSVVRPLPDRARHPQGGGRRRPR